MFGNLTSALGSSGTALRQPPAPGTANAPANPVSNFMGGIGQPQQRMGGVANPQRQQGNGMMTTQPVQPGIGNLGPIGAPQTPPTASSMQQVMSQLHPQATAALKAIPQATLAHLTQAGLMHPGVMQHLYGNNNGMAS